MSDTQKKDKETKVHVQIEPEMLELGNMIAGINKSVVNVVFFKDMPQYWIQYHVGIYLKRPTFVVIRKEDKKRFAKRFNHELVQEVYDVAEFTQQTVDMIAGKINIYLERKKINL